MARLLLALVALLSLAGRAWCSSGDARPDFRACVRRCASPACGANATAADAPAACSPLCPSAAAAEGRGPPARAPVALRLLRWDCAADCRYLCMWAVEAGKAAAAAAAGRAPPRPEKYFGKWPFARVAGMQEPASVAASLANLAVYARALAAGAPLARAGGGGGPHARLWAAHLAAGAAAWAASAAFHARDTRATERADYYAAGAAVALLCVATAVRVGGVRSGRGVAAIAGGVGLLYAAHVAHMQLVLFDYGRHVALCVAAGAAQSAAWLAWAAAGAGRAHPARRQLLAFVPAINAAVLLEVLDFPPAAAAVDAHALWHCVTPALAAPWLAFVAADMQLGGAPGGGGGRKAS